MSQTLVAYKKIWATVDLIPKGKVASYGQIADLAGLPGRARLVGKSLGHVPKGRKVAWHKVLRSSGQLALLQTGLLQEDDVVVLNNRVKLSEFQWHPDLGELLFGLKY